jgi:hypothetical protein
LDGRASEGETVNVPTAVSPKLSVTENRWIPAAASVIVTTQEKLPFCVDMSPEQTCVVESSRTTRGLFGVKPAPWKVTFVSIGPDTGVSVRYDTVNTVVALWAVGLAESVPVKV